MPTLRNIWRNSDGTSLVSDLIIVPIYMMFLFASILFMFFLRSQVIIYEAAYLALNATQGAVALNDADAAYLGEQAAGRFLDAVNAVTVRDITVTRTRSGGADQGGLYRIVAEIEGGWEPGPLLNMSGKVTAEICLQARARVLTVEPAGIC